MEIGNINFLKEYYQTISHTTQLLLIHMSCHKKKNQEMFT